jgi:plastocyanin
MKRIFTFLMVLVFVLAIGCGKQSAPAVPTEPAVQAPVLNQVQPEKEEKEAPAVKANVPAPAEEEKSAAIGSLVTGNEPAAKEEQEVPSESSAEIRLNADKTMSETAVKVDVGTTLSWKNYDSWPHEISVISGKGLDTKLHSKSPRLVEGNVWSYTFSEKGEFVAKDTFAGKMRMNVTVE